MKVKNIAWNYQLHLSSYIFWLSWRHLRMILSLTLGPPWTISPNKSAAIKGSAETIWIPNIWKLVRYSGSKFTKLYYSGGSNTKRSKTESIWKPNFGKQNVSKFGFPLWTIRIPYAFGIRAPTVLQFSRLAQF